MRISIYSECGFFKSGLQCLIGECGFLQDSGDVRLCIVYVKKIYDSMSLLNCLVNNAFDFSLNRDRIIVACPGGTVHGSELPGINIVNGSMSLKEWRLCIKNCAEEVRPEEKLRHCIVAGVFQRQISRRETQLLNCMRLNMSPSEMACMQKVSVKTMYSRIATVRNKYRLRSTRDLYLNADYIYQNITQLSGDNV
ncbi:helix-turn-helix transcriptional regulator [Enterobacter roggenkampii]|uniref:helix-turn-helix transcriptional regulator n=1 Tax=Enterobacter roggenkampii TaxID=1812935 RepID=UPI000FCC795A|nr:hypothetical protein [Enterobacter roggenkampii]WFC89303.1 hypothetical protein OM420_12110 [Enterobacter roggenkampii]